MTGFKEIRNMAERVREDWLVAREACNVRVTAPPGEKPIVRCNIGGDSRPLRYCLYDVCPKLNPQVIE